MSCCTNYQEKGSKTVFFTWPKVKPMNERKSIKAREGKLKAVANNKQRQAWTNAMKKDTLIAIISLKITRNKQLVFSAKSTY